MWAWLWAVGQGWKNVEAYDRQGQKCFDQTVSRNLDVENTAGDDSEGSEKHIFGN